MGKNQFESITQSTAFDLLENLKSDDGTEGIDLVSLLSEDPAVSSPESYASNTSLDEDDDLVVKTDDTFLFTKQQKFKVKEEPFTDYNNGQLPLNDFVASFLETSSTDKKQTQIQQKPQLFTAPFTGLLPSFFPQMIPTITPTINPMTQPIVQTQVKNCKVEEDEKVEARRKRLKRRREQRQPEVKSEDEIKKEENPHKSKELKRQKRLIKNRESAQASRERKKLYVQGLEKKLSELTSKTNSLSTKVMSLEEENKILREQLQKALRGEKVEEPIPKKRKLCNEIPPQNVKLPLPPMSMMNMFNRNFWTQLIQQPTFPGTNGSQVVLFVMLFCVGVFMLQTGINFDKTAPAFPLDKKQVSEHVEMKRAGGRTLLETSPKGSDKPNTEIAKDIESLQGEFVNFLKVISDEKNISKKAKVENIDMNQWKELEELIGKISLSWDTDKQNLLFKFPMKDEISETKDQHELKNVVSVSRNLLSEICTKLTKVC